MLEEAKTGQEQPEDGRVAYLARLARIALAADEMERLEQDLQSILGYVSQINGVDTDGVEPTFHVLPLTNVFREDVVEPSLPPEDVFASAPDRSGSFFRVPRVI